MRGLMAACVLLIALGTAFDRGFWVRPDHDPFRQGVRLYRAGDFKGSAEALGRAGGAEAAYDRGNAFVLLGKYDLAIASYDRALTLRPGWSEAADNRRLAALRRDRLKTKGGDATGGEVAPDDIVVNDAKGDGQAATTDGAPTDEELRGLWLRNVRTKPADFLRAKFAFQQAKRGDAP